MGELIGGLLVIYLVGKVLELVILKRFIASFRAMVFTSSALVFLAILLLRVGSGDPNGVFPMAMLVSFLLAAVILPVVKTVWHTRRATTAAG
jgi:hypothetical protein